ncbi:MAG: NADH-quinone oxidoreductase subunit H [Chloroflexi bacterium]|jgi:NADH-quinone oxidoreductase subunit H|nr:MAG: NADH-quinone oxidoreductase subunit H [Chloroflexota bacterium]
MSYFIAGFAVMFAIVNAMMLLATLYIWFERRALGRFQVRQGPNRWGPFGLLQPIADALKILGKEDIVPHGADRWVFNIAPIVMFFPVPMIVAVLPIAKNVAITDINVGLLFVVAITGFSTLAIFMAGWASGNRYALFGAARAVAMLISYEIPLIITLGSIALLSGSLAMGTIVATQNVPYLLVQPLAFVIFMMAISAEMNRSPFDIVEAESELIAGYHTEYSGMKFGMFMLAEFAAVIVASGLATTIFLQGWRWPFLPSAIWFLLKMGMFVFLFLWIRATIPRLRVDQILAFAWKFLLPLSVVSLFATALEVFFLREPDGSLTTNTLWIMSGINFGLAIVALVGWANVLGHRRYNPAPRIASMYRDGPLGSRPVEVQ